MHCTHRRSCDKAKFYNRKCSGTKLDGNNDGIPSERYSLQKA
ncbi:excalibur calcium-binding domain-containing protein [Shewanella mesophila]|nr:excalibur calcium-binding domain-containing protein [Shewanella mesophila]QYJ88126.1 excalibur calcium-binding domain-containing protein [Shewanella mesophila]